MTKLLLNTSSLVIKIKGNFDFPTNKHAKTATIKKLLKVIESSSAELEYLGHDFERPYTGSLVIEDSLVVAMHIIEDPIAIDYLETVDEQVARFLRHIKKNTSRILLQQEFKSDGKVEQFFEIYVRAVADSSRAYRNLRQA